MSDSVRKPLSEPTRHHQAANEIHVGLPAFWAVIMAETNGCRSRPDRRPQFLFERHVFHKRVN